LNNQILLKSKTPVFAGVLPDEQIHDGYN